MPIKLPAPLADLANARHGRYVLAARLRFPCRGQEWADRVEANRAVAYRILYDTGRGRWRVDASWQVPPTATIPFQAALADGVIGVDTNADHLAAWRLDTHGNPIGRPRPFFYDLSQGSQHRDAQVRARPHTAAELGQSLRRPGHRGRRPRLPGRENQREARAQAPIQASNLRYADRQAPRPADLHGPRHRHRDHHRGPCLHQPLGRPALPKADGRPRS